jgi:hypothetical protein
MGDMTKTVRPPNIFLTTNSHEIALKIVREEAGA